MVTGQTTIYYPLTLPSSSSSWRPPYQHRHPQPFLSTTALYAGPQVEQRQQRFVELRRPPLGTFHTAPAEEEEEEEEDFQPAHLPQRPNKMQYPPHYQAGSPMSSSPSRDTNSGAAAKAKAATGKTSSGAANSRDSKRRATHSQIERRRREKINDRLITLRNLVPACLKEVQDRQRARVQESEELRLFALGGARPGVSRSALSDVTGPGGKPKRKRNRKKPVVVDDKDKEPELGMHKLEVLTHVINYVYELHAEIEELKTGKRPAKIRRVSDCEDDKEEEEEGDESQRGDVGEGKAAEGDLDSSVGASPAFRAFAKAERMSPMDSLPSGTENSTPVKRRSRSPDHYIGASPNAMPPRPQQFDKTHARALSTGTDTTSDSADFTATFGPMAQHKMYSPHGGPGMPRSNPMSPLSYGYMNSGSSSENPSPVFGPVRGSSGNAYHWPAPHRRRQSTSQAHLGQGQYSNQTTPNTLSGDASSTLTTPSSLGHYVPSHSGSTMAGAGAGLAMSPSSIASLSSPFMSLSASSPIFFASNGKGGNVHNSAKGGAKGIKRPGQILHDLELPPAAMDLDETITWHPHRSGGSGGSGGSNNNMGESIATSRRHGHQRSATTTASSGPPPFYPPAASRMTTATQSLPQSQSQFQPQSQPQPQSQSRSRNQPPALPDVYGSTKSRHGSLSSIRDSTQYDGNVNVNGNGNDNDIGNGNGDGHDNVRLMSSSSSTPSNGRQNPRSDRVDADVDVDAADSLLVLSNSPEGALRPVGGRGSARQQGQGQGYGQGQAPAQVQAQGRKGPQSADRQRDGDGYEGREMYSHPGQGRRRRESIVIRRSASPPHWTLE